MKKLLFLFLFGALTMLSFAQPAWPTISEATTKVPADILELSKDYCINESFTPAHVKVDRVPQVRVQHRWVNGKRIEVSRDTTWRERRTNVAEVRRVSQVSGSPMLNWLISTVNTAAGQLEYRGRTGNTWTWHKVGIRWRGPDGKLHDIPPFTVTVTLLSDQRFEIRHTNTNMIRYARRFDPNTTLTSFLPYIAVENGVAYNRTLINGKPWNEVNIRSLFVNGKQNQDFVWRWWTYGDTGLTTAGHRDIDGYATSIEQFAKNDPRGQTMNIQQGPVGRYDKSTHTFTYPSDTGNPIYFMLQAEFLPAQHKQEEYRGYYLMYPWGHTPQGFGFLWPVKDFDPNMERY